jgi:hypothetical protein
VCVGRELRANIFIPDAHRADGKRFVVGAEGGDCVCGTRNRRFLRATILIGVVVLSVAGVFQIRFKSSTKRSPMAASKDVVIGHSAVNEYGKIARANPV